MIMSSSRFALILIFTLNLNYCFADNFENNKTGNSIDLPETSAFVVAGNTVDDFEEENTGNTIGLPETTTTETLKFTVGADVTTINTSTSTVLPVTTTIVPSEPPVIGSHCSTCQHNISMFCEYKTFKNNCPTLEVKIFNPNAVIDCHQMHFSCRAACDGDVTMNLVQKDGNITISAPKAAQFIGYCTGNDVWTVKDVRTGIVYNDVLLAQCLKLMTEKEKADTTRGDSSTSKSYQYKTGPSEGYISIIPDIFDGIFNLFGVFGGLGGGRTCT